MSVGDANPNMFNRTPVPLEDSRFVSVNGEHVRMAPGCLDCPIFHINKIRQDLYLPGGWYQMSFDQDQYGEPDEPRSQKEAVASETLRRADNGRMGLCRFIESEPDCWRREPIKPVSPEQAEGTVLARRAGHALDMLRKRSEARRQLEQAVANLEIAHRQGQIDNRLDPPRERIQRYKAEIKEASSDIEELLDTYSRLKVASDVLLGIYNPEAEEQAGQPE